MHISTAKITSERSHACTSIELVEVLTFSIFASGEARGERIGHWQLYMALYCGIYKPLSLFCSDHVRYCRLLRAVPVRLHTCQAFTFQNLDAGV